MAHNTASPIQHKRSPLVPRGKSRRVPIDCVGCFGKKEKKRQFKLFCGKCAQEYHEAKHANREIDSMFERAIA